MSEILFKKLTIENFLSIGSGSLDLDNRGLLLIQGVNDSNPSANSNGAGKSSCVDALCWALYGTTARGLSGDSVVNRFEGKNCRVSIAFLLNGKTYEVARHRKHKSGKNRLMFSCDGADLTLGTDRLTQESIEKTIGCSLEVFTSSIYSGQNNMPNLPAMTDKELKQLVESAAGIELLDAAYSIARERSKTQETLLDSARLEFAHASNLVDQANRQLQDARDAEARFKDEKAAEITRRHDLLREAVKEAKAQKTQVDALDESVHQAQIDDLERRIAAQTKPVPIAAPVAPLLEPLPPPPALPVGPTSSAHLVSLEQDKTKLTFALDSATVALRALMDKVRNVDSSIGKPCDECGKPYSEHDLAEIKSRLTAEAKSQGVTIGKLRSELAEIDDFIRAEHEILARAQDDADQKAVSLQVAHEERCSQINERNASARAEYDAALATYQNALEAQRAASASSESAKLVAALREAQSALENVRAERAKLTAMLDRVRDRKVEWERAQAAPNPHTPLIAAQSKRLAELEGDRDAASAKVEERTLAANDAQVVVELFSPKGMRGEILDSVTPFLNARTAQYLGVLSDGTISAEWSTIGETGKGELREKFHIKVSNADGAEVYEGLSGGEQRKVRISTAMALQDLVASRADRPIKLFVADEVDDALDVSGLERLMAVLDDKARYVGSVIVISHNDLDDFISNTVVVVKGSDGKSTIVDM